MNASTIGNQSSEIINPHTAATDAPQAGLKGDGTIRQVSTTTQQLAARSQLRELKVRAEQKISSSTQTPQFLVIEHGPYHTDSFSSYAARNIAREQERNKGVAHLQKLIATAYPVTGDSEYDQKISEIKTNFESYLSSKKEGDASKIKNQVSAQALHAVLRDLHVTRLNEEHRQEQSKGTQNVLSLEEEQLFPRAVPSQGKQEAALSSMDQYQIDGYDVGRSLTGFNNFFSKYNMSLEKSVGEGSFAKVYPISSTDNKFSDDKYVFKWIEREVKQDPKVEFWRQQEFALHRRGNIPNVARSLFFIVKVTTPSVYGKLYLLPADQLKTFGLHLPPGATVTLKGQFMERAPGMNLAALNEQAVMKEESTKIPIVKNIARDLFKTLQEMHRHNLLHGDISLSNVFHDPITSKTTLLDLGLAQRLRKHEKGDQQFHKNPPTGNTTSKLKDLANGFRSPRVWKEQGQHGSEVDFFSYAMILLNTISSDDFGWFGYRATGDPKRSSTSPKEYLEYYLSKAHDGNGAPSATAKVFEENPELREVIDLAFQVSEGGKKGEAAFQKLEKIEWLKEENSFIDVQNSSAN